MDAGLIFLDLAVALTMDIMAANRPEPVQVAQSGGRAYMVSEQLNGDTKNCIYSNGQILTIASFAPCPTSVRQ